jgi:hypothetical protein
MKNTLRGIVTVLALASVFLCGTACHKTTLEQGGAYAPGSWTTNADNSTTFTASAAADPIFYQVDAAFNLAYSAIDGVFNFERDNRAYLWSVSHNIKHVLDDIRPKALDASQRFLKARRIYLSNPTPAGLSNLQTILTEIQSLSTAATAVVPK